MTWLIEASARKQKFIQTPANTSHFLQPCDQTTNMRISFWMKRTVEALLSNHVLAVQSVQCKLTCGIEVHRQLLRTEIMHLWVKTGL